jgi:hypothetical protein
MNFDKPSETLGPLFVGAVSAACMQSRTGWWLNSGTGIACTVATLFLLAVLFASWKAASPWPRAIGLWVGSMTGLTASLFWIGPGTIWPIVLIVASIITACTVIAGTGVGRLCCFGYDCGHG